MRLDAVSGLDPDVGAPVLTTEWVDAIEDVVGATVPEVVEVEEAIPVEEEAIEVEESTPVEEEEGGRNLSVEFTEKVGIKSP